LFQRNNSLINNCAVRHHSAFFLNTKTGMLTVTVHSLYNRRRRWISYIFVYPM